MSTARVPLAVAGLTLLAFGLRVAGLGQSLFGDEYFLHAIVHDRSLAGALDVVHDTESTPPLHFVLAWLGAQVGDDTVTMRLPSLIAGTLLVPAVFALGREVAGERAGLLACAFVALSPFTLFYGIEGRAYALAMLLLTLSTWTLLRALRSPPGEQRWWLLFVLATAAAVYTHYATIFVLLAQFAWALGAHRERLREVLIAYGVAVLLYLPWLPYFRDQQRGTNAADTLEGLYDVTVGQSLRDVLRVLIAHPFLGTATVPGTAVVFLGLFVLVAIAAAAVVAAVRDGARPSRPVVLIAALAAATPVGAALYSLGPESVWATRNLGMSVPFAAVAVGILLARLPRAATVVAATVLFGVLAVGAIQESSRDRERGDFRAIARRIDARSGPADPVVELTLSHGPVGRALGAYFERPHPTYLTERPPDAAQWRRAHAARRTFVVVPRAGVFAGAVADPFEPVPGVRFRTVEEREYPAMNRLRLFEFAPVR